MTSLVANFQWQEGGVTIPTNFLREDFIEVYGDLERLYPPEYSFENDGKGGKILTTKAPYEVLCLVYRPDVSFELRKFDPSIVDKLNHQFERVAQNISLLNWQSGKSLGGDPCDMGGYEIIEELVEQIESVREDCESKISTVKSEFSDVFEEYFARHRDKFYSDNPNANAVMIANSYSNVKIAIAGRNDDYLQELQAYNPFTPFVLSDDVVAIVGCEFELEVQASTVGLRDTFNQDQVPAIAGTDIQCGQCVLLAHTSVIFEQEHYGQH